MLEFAVALGCDHNGSHLVALGEDDLVDLASIEPVEELVEHAHRLAHGRQLIVGHAEVRFAHGPDGTERRGQIADDPSSFRPGPVATCTTSRERRIDGACNAQVLAERFDELGLADRLRVILQALDGPCCTSQRAADLHYAVKHAIEVKQARRGGAAGRTA